MIETAKTFRKQYTLSNTFMLRVPLLSLSVLEKVSKTKDIDGLLLNYLRRLEFMEAIFLSSPRVQELCEEWSRGELNAEETEKVRRTVLKYITRMASRSTPFGMFAGIGTGHFGSTNMVEVDTASPHKLSIRPDMHYLGTVAEKVNNDALLRERMVYFPNNSIFLIGDTYRFVEYKIDPNGYRKYHLQATLHNEALELVLEEAMPGVPFRRLTTCLQEIDIDEDSAKEYIHTLVDNQILVPEIEARVSGGPYPEELLSRLEYMDRIHPATTILKRIMTGVLSISQADGKDDSRLVAFKGVYKNAAELRNNNGLDGLLQVDTKVNFSRASISEHVRADLLDVIPVLIKLSREQENKLLKNFREQFEMRYAGSEVPLSIALDAEIGLAYNSNANNDGEDPLLDDLRIAPQQVQEKKIPWAEADRFLYGKLQQALYDTSGVIVLKDDELEHLPAKHSNFPLSFAIMARILDPVKGDEQRRLIQLISAGGSSAVNLAGRFAHMDKTLLAELKDITQREQQVLGETLLAEIIHLPQQRTGNILMRPELRDFEIPYLARSSVKKTRQIPVNDLLVSVRGKKVLLRSKKLNRFIVPRLSNAHNYTLGALPVYRFLCDLQSQGVNANLSFSWGMPEYENPYLPRVMYRNIILEAASWNIFGQDLQGLRSAGTTAIFSKKVKELKQKYGMPDEVLLCAGDNELWIDLTNVHLLELLRAEVKSAERVTLKEYLGKGSESLVNCGGKPYANECLFFIKPSLMQ